jgi:replicative DNA helicase
MNEKKRWTKKDKETSIESYNEMLPPYNADIESIVLGTIILDKDIIHSCIQDFNESLFFSQQNKDIANAILALYQRNVGIDLLTIVQELKKTNGSVDILYITGLTNRVASTTNFEHHFRILQEDALKRLLINVCGSALRKSFENSEDVFKLFSTTQIELDNAIKNVVTYQVAKVGQVHNNILKVSYDCLNSGVKSGVETGLTMLDNVTNGWQKSDLIILAGRPSMGKTSCAISMIMHPAIDKKEPIAIFSLEMSTEQLVSRMQSILSSVNVGRIVKKQLNIDEIQSIERNAFVLNDAPIYIDDTAAISLMALKGKARKLVNECGVKLIVIDYLQLMRSGLNTNNRESEIAEISRGLKAIAKELNIPVIALSQLSRQVESRADKKPQLSDLRESGQIEQDADMVLFCYRPEYYGIDNYEVGGSEFQTDGLFMLLIEKHRNGELGEVPLKFIHHLAKVTNLISSSNEFGNQSNYSTFVQQETTNSNSALVNARGGFDSMNLDETPF